MTPRAAAEVASPRSPLGSRPRSVPHRGAILLGRPCAVGRLMLLAGALLLLSACSMPRRPEIAERIAGIDEARLRAHVAALCELGPRPIEDTVATERTVAWLRGQLERLGLEVSEEPVSWLAQTGRLIANVRRRDADPDSEPEQLDLEPWYWAYGSRVIESQSQRLRGEGWELLGYSVRFSDAALVEVRAPNLLVEFPGSSGRPGVVELSAHYDTVAGSPGADDNSSGVAALLEIARVLAASPPERTVRLCFFAGEEQGLLGSEVHVAGLQRRGEDVVGLLNLDSVGYATGAPDSQQAPVRIVFVTWMPSTGDFITVIGDWSSGSLGNLFEAAVDTYVPELPYYSANRIGGWFEDGRRSDHAPYWDAGIPALFLTDTGEFRTNTYHRPGDLPAELDYRYLRQVAQAAAAAALELARR